ncbi:MAG: discoidin domain-containing protein, partial [Firmicutes bacterium]|nr:discoidin domain-containing protein [Bacillota bacterium]
MKTRTKRLKSPAVLVLAFALALTFMPISLSAYAGYGGYAEEELGAAHPTPEVITNLTDRLRQQHQADLTAVVTASSVTSPNYPPRAINGIVDQGWISASQPGGTMLNPPQWLRINLGEVATVTQVVIHQGSSGANSRTYLVLGSTSPIPPTPENLGDFSVLGSFDLPGDGQAPRETHFHNVNNGRYQYIWFYVTRSHPTHFRAFLMEIQVFGAFDGDGTEPPPAHPQIGEFYVFYGLLHGHSAVSDGGGEPIDWVRGHPDNAHRFARDVAGLDFFSLTDHNNVLKRQANTRWTQYYWDLLYNAAQNYNEDGRFVTFFGQEMSTTNMGHINVIHNPNTGLSFEENYFFNYSDFREFANEREGLNAFYKWLDTQPAVGFFNHPGDYVWDTWYPTENWGPEFNFFNPIDGFITDRMVGMELFNRTTGFEIYYYQYRWGDFRDRLTPDSRVQLTANTFLDEANRQGWRIGAAGADDNHSMNWGAKNDFRMAILAPELTRDALFYAMENRRFYVTKDSNLALSFTIGGHEMGSLVQPGPANLVVEAFNANGLRFRWIRLMRNGEQIGWWSFDEENPRIVLPINAAAGDYYYVIVTQANGREAISSPIWITADGLAPAPITVAPSAPAEVIYTGHLYNHSFSYFATATTNDPAPTRPASAAIDGTTIPGSGFLSAMVASPAAPVTLTVDLGSSQAIRAIRILSNPIRDFEILAANDANFTTYTTLRSVTGNTNANIAFYTYRLFEPLGEYRYVRLVVTQGGADGLVRVDSFEIYGDHPPDPGLGRGEGVEFTMYGWQTPWNNAWVTGMVNHTRREGTTIHGASCDQAVGRGPERLFLNNPDFYKGPWAQTPALRHVPTFGNPLTGEAPWPGGGSSWRPAVDGMDRMPQWIALDLYETRNIEVIHLFHESFGGGENRNFRVQGSHTGLYHDFYNIVIVEGNTSGVTTIILNEPVAYRYVRFLATVGSGTGGGTVRLFTFEVYGRDDISTPPPDRTPLPE